jgi:hypothetical protein
LSSEWTRENEIFARWSRSRKIITYCQKSSIFAWDKDWVQVIDDFSESWILRHWTRFLSIRTIVITFLLEKEIFLHQSDNIQISSDQNDSNDDLCRTRRVWDEISLNQNCNNHSRSLTRFCDNSLKNLIWRVLYRVLMMIYDLLQDNDSSV